jgi:hypothetical protein
LADPARVIERKGRTMPVIITKHLKADFECSEPELIDVTLATRKDASEPWKLMIRSDLIRAGRLNMAEMKTYYPENKKQDTVAKFLYLLELEKTGKVELIQEKPFGDILIRSNETDVDSAIEVVDREGRDFQFDWLELNPRQRSRLIEDVKQHKILCRFAGAK